MKTTGKWHKPLQVGTTLRHSSTTEEWTVKEIGENHVILDNGQSVPIDNLWMMEAFYPDHQAA